MKMASDLKPATSITLESIKESICMLLLKATFMASKALVASKQPLQASGHPQIWNLWPQLPLVSICILPLVAILVASEAMLASKWPWRTHLRSGLNSVTSITYVPMLLWPVKASLRWFTQTNKQGQLLTIELRSFACSQLKIVESASLTNLAHWP